jgi:hypothetical protein
VKLEVPTFNVVKKEQFEVRTLQHQKDVIKFNQAA